MHVCSFLFNGQRLGQWHGAILYPGTRAAFCPIAGMDWLPWKLHTSYLWGDGTLLPNHCAFHRSPTFSIWSLRFKEPVLSPAWTSTLTTFSQILMAPQDPPPQRGHPGSRTIHRALSTQHWKKINEWEPPIYISWGQLTSSWTLEKRLRKTEWEMCSPWQIAQEGQSAPSCSEALPLHPQPWLQVWLLSLVTEHLEAPPPSKPQFSLL